MGFWNVVAKDLRKGDEIRVTTMGGSEFLTVEDLEPPDGPEIRVKLAWGWHIPVESFWDTLPIDERLTVRR